MYEIDSILKHKRILAIVAHPDDLEDYFGGTLLYGLKNNLINPEEIFLVVCTDGSKGGRDKFENAEDLKKARRQEQLDAFKYLNISNKNIFFMDFADGEIHNDGNVLIERISYFIRKVRPNIIFTHNGFETIIERPEGFYYNHKDHRIIGQCAMDAMYPYSRDLLFFPEHKSENLLGHSVFEVLLSETQFPNLKVNITQFIKQKTELFLHFESQVTSREEIEEYFDLMHKEDGEYYENFKYIKLVI